MRRGSSRHSSLYNKICDFSETEHTHTHTHKLKDVTTNIHATNINYTCTAKVLLY